MRKISKVGEKPEIYVANKLNRPLKIPPLTDHMKCVSNFKDG